MRPRVLGGLLVLMLCSTFALPATHAVASDWPVIGGDFWEVTGVHLKDGGGLAYLNFLATEWKADQEFAKSKGWIKGYMLLSNSYTRKGEPDLFLVVITDHVSTGPEADKRADEYTAWKKKTEAQMMKESGDRLQFREIGSNWLLQEFKFRK